MRMNRRLCDWIMRLRTKQWTYVIWRIFGRRREVHHSSAPGLFPDLTTEDSMRKAIDCRDYPSEMHCTVALSADSADELLEIAAAHAVTAHGHADTPELRAVLRGMFKDAPDDRPGKN